MCITYTINCIIKRIVQSRSCWNKSSVQTQFKLLGISWTRLCNVAVSEQNKPSESVQCRTRIQHPKTGERAGIYRVFGFIFIVTCSERNEQCLTPRALVGYRRRLQQYILPGFAATSRQLLSNRRLKSHPYSRRVLHSERIKQSVRSGWHGDLYRTFPGAWVTPYLPFLFKPQKAIEVNYHRCCHR